MAHARDPSPERIAEFVDFIAAAAAIVDDIGPRTLHMGEPREILLLHGLARYTLDTARAAVELCLAGAPMQAAVLTRVVMEHAAVIAWIQRHEDGVADFDRQSQAGWAAWHGVVSSARHDALRPLDADINRKRIPGLDSPKRTFDGIDGTGQMYVQYRNLSKLVHPDPTTIGCYMTRTEDAATLNPEPLSRRINPESLMFYAAVSVGLAARHLLEADEDWRRLTILGETARDAGVPLDLTPDYEPTRSDDP